MRASFSARLLFVVCSLFFLSLLSQAATHSSPLKPSSYDTSISRMADDILGYINSYRSTKGLPALQMNTEIAMEAQKHSADMAKNRIAFGHDGFENRVNTISKKIGNMHSSAENVAYGNLSPKEVVDVWLKSPGHRKNIEGKYTLTGIGTATSKDNVIFFTQIFISK